jgi:hypothetical protein
VAFGESSVWVARSTGTGFATPTRVLGGFGINSGSWQVEKHVRLLGDVNGDRKQDIVGFGRDGVWLALSTGIGFAAPTFVLADFGYTQGWRVEKHVRLLADINNDNRQDIVAFGDDGVWTALATSTGFDPPRFVFANFGYNQAWRVEKHVRLLADINNDNRQDIVAFGDDGVLLSLSTGTGFAAPMLVPKPNVSDDELTP